MAEKREMAVQSPTQERREVRNGDSSSSSWNEFPDDLKENILLRLPLKSFFWLRRVSKGWKSLLSSKPFLRKWASESSRNPFLVLFSLNTQPSCLLYSFESESWQTLSLSLSFLKQEHLNHIFVCTSGFLLVDIGDYSIDSPYPSLRFCNPLNRTFRGLPHIPHAVRTVMASGIAAGVEGYKVIILGRSSQNGVEVQLYDSVVGSWRLIPAALPEPLVVRERKMVFCAGKFFCLTLDPPGIVMFEIQGAFNCTVSRMPSDTDRCLQLVTCGGFVFVVSATFENRKVDVIIWQYCSPTWQEVTTMGEFLWEVYKNSKSGAIGNLECVGVGDNICFRVDDSLNVLAYSITRRSWTWLPTCPVKYEKCRHLDVRSLSFHPRPDMEV